MKLLAALLAIAAAAGAADVEIGDASGGPSWGSPFGC